MRRIIDSVRNRENTDRKDVDLGKGVTGQYRLTNNGDQFLMTEITVNNKPLIMFASYRNLQLLSSSNIILVDGTFDVVPNGFTQLYTIHGYVSEMKPNIIEMLNFLRFPRVQFVLLFTACFHQRNKLYTAKFSTS
uniref:Uncharacterized protein n=1 Tax=Caenorhabditis japonica TaxID=281687 RepID=A0A8R1E8G6_CAEJA